MELFNSRREIEFYQFDVFDLDWNPVPFATAERIIQLSYLDRKKIDIYVKTKNPVYICSTSKILAGAKGTVISSKICSKAK